MADLAMEALEKVAGGAEEAKKFGQGLKNLSTAEKLAVFGMVGAGTALGGAGGAAAATKYHTGHIPFRGGKFVYDVDGKTLRKATDKDKPEDSVFFDENEVLKLAKLNKVDVKKFDFSKIDDTAKAINTLVKAD